jgi:Ca2+-binding EF-hand superfamily protein
MVMRARFLAPLVAFALLAPPALAQLPSTQEVDRRFNLFDADRDGRISPTEYEINKVTALFEPPNQRTGSGDVSRRAIEIKPADTRLNAATFRSFDLNGDNVLSAAEIVGANQLRFEAIDSNTDGFIDREEFSALVRALFN